MKLSKGTETRKAIIKCIVDHNDDIEIEQDD